MRTAVSVLACALLASAAPPQKIFPLPYDQHDLPNGLRVITVPTDFPNVVALYIVVSVGSRNEVEPGKSGFAHFFEHMMFRGTKTFPPEKYEAALKQAGASSNAFTSNDLTVYHTTFSKEDLEKMIAMEADRFQNLEYAESAFRTEALAVLGEYNKNAASPTRKLDEVLRNTAFDTHTYKHTTMGFLEDVKDMPNQFEYSKQFFARFYRPEYTTILVVGDVQPEQVRKVAAKYWASWKRGDYKAAIPAEQAPKGPRTNHVKWPEKTLPWVSVAHRAPAYSDTDKDYAALDIIASLGFSESSELYQKLVIQEQKVDTLFGGSRASADPFLFNVAARVKNENDVTYVRDQILETLASLKEPVSAAKLDRVKKNLRYSFAQSLDSSDAIAGTLASYIALKRTPETINRLYDVYDSITPADIQRVAKTYFVEQGRTIVTLSGGEAK